MKALRGFLVKVIILVVIIIIADRIFGTLFKRVFRIQERGKYFTTSYALAGSKENIMIFGNSHAAQHFNANRLTDSLQSATFNFGNQNQSILYYYPVIESMLLHHNPKLVILNLDFDELLYHKNDYEKLSILLPYYNDNRFIDSAITLIGANEKYKAVSNFYRFNSTIGYVCLSFISRSYEKSVASRGFDPQGGSLCKQTPDDDTGEALTGEKEFVDTLKLRYLYQIISDLKKRDIKLVVTTTPVFNGKNKKLFAWDTLKSILSKGDIDYLNYYDDGRFDGKCALFHDAFHLNTTGADIFTDIIINEIRHKNLLK